MCEAWKLIWMKTLKSRRVQGACSPRKCPHQKIKTYAIWGFPEIICMESKLFHSHCHGLEPPHWQPGECCQSHVSRLKMIDHHPKHHLTPVCTPLSSHLNWKLGTAMYEIKISDCNIMTPSTNAFQASFAHKLSLPAQLVFFLRKVASFVILRSMSLFGVAQQLKKFF